MSTTLFHSSSSTIIAKLWICYITRGIYFSISFGVCFETQRLTLSKLSTRVVFWGFFVFCLDRWRKFRVGLRIKGRIKEQGIKKDDVGEGCPKKKKTVKKETLEISTTGFWCPGDVYILFLYHPLKILWKVVLSLGRGANSVAAKESLSLFKISDCNPGNKYSN